MHLRFVVSESTFDYFRSTRCYLETHGKPVAFYSDKHSIFRVNAKDPAGGDGATQFGRALIELNIDILCANSPQAKGRVERAFGTLQDRLVKELRLADISTIAAANAWLPEFVENYNRRFSRTPANPKDLHRPLTQADDLDEILAWREARTVTRNLTLRYDRMMLLLDPTPFARGLAGKKVEVVNYPDGRFAVRHERVTLPFRVFDKIRTVARRDRREQAAGCGTGVRARAAGVLSAKPQAGRSTPPEAAKQFGGTGYADKRPPIATGSGSHCG
jgi:hypothetical protein